MTNFPKTTEEIRKDYDTAPQYFKDSYTFEEYRSRFYFELDLVKEAALNVAAVGSIEDVVDYVLERVADVYGGYNNGCSCCATTTLRKELGFETDLDDDDEE